MRSFRCQNIKNLFRWGQKHFAVKGILDTKNLPLTLEVNYGEKRRLQFNENHIYKASEYLGHLFTVTFVPDDIKLIRGTSAERRRFIDITLSQLVPEYLTCSQNYYKALKSRNLLLKRQQPSSKSIRAFDPILIRNGALICQYREQFLAKVGTVIDELSEKILSNHFYLTCRYNCSSPMKNPKPKFEDFENAISASLKSNLDRDLQYRMTHSGPHRDDFVLFLNKRQLQNFGSEGQCRSAALLLKMATGRVFLKEKKDDVVIFLVDDISGELDGKHKDSFLSLIQEPDQVLFACTNLETPSQIKPAKIYEVINGTVESRLN